MSGQLSSRRPSEMPRHRVSETYASVATAPSGTPRGRPGDSVGRIRWVRRGLGWVVAEIVAVEVGCAEAGEAAGDETGHVHLAHADGLGDLVLGHVLEVPQKQD